MYLAQATGRGGMGEACAQPEIGPRLNIAQDGRVFFAVRTGGGH